MKKLIITSICIITTLMLACNSIQKRNIDFDKIDNIAFWQCVGNRITFLYDTEYIPTAKGYRNIQSFCYYYLKETGVIK